MKEDPVAVGKMTVEKEDVKAVYGSVFVHESVVTVSREVGALVTMSACACGIGKNVVFDET